MISSIYSCASLAAPGLGVVVEHVLHGDAEDEVEHDEAAVEILCEQYDLGRLLENLRLMREQIFFQATYLAKYLLNVPSVFISNVVLFYFSSTFARWRP